LLLTRVNFSRDGKQREIEYAAVVRLCVEAIFWKRWAIVVYLQSGERLVLMMPQKDADNVRAALSQIGRSTGLACAV
jgi:hypothetical protein